MKRYVLAAVAAAAVSAFVTCALVDRSAHAQAANSSYVGEIIAVPYGWCPYNWLPAEGQHVPIAQNQALYQLLGTTYGGDGQTTFGLPNPAPIHTKNGKPLVYCIATRGVFPSKA